MGVKGMPRLANPRIGQWSEIWGNWLIEIIVMIKTSKQASPQYLTRTMLPTGTHRYTDNASPAQTSRIHAG